MKYVFIINPSAGTENSVGMIREAVNRSEKKDQCEFTGRKGQIHRLRRRRDS